MISGQNKRGYAEIVQDGIELATSATHLILLVNTTGTTSGARTVYLSEAHEFAPVSNRVRVAQSFAFCIVFCRSV